MSNVPLIPEAQRHVDRGLALLAQHDLAAAHVELQRALQLAPGARTVLAALGSLAMQAQDWAAAERIFRQADSLHPGAFRQQLALAIFNQQRYQDALPLLEEIAASPDMDLNCALAYAMTLERCSLEDRSVAVMISIYRALRSEQMAVLLCSALLRLGRAAELDEWLPELLAAYPDNAVLLASRSEHAFMSGDYATGFDYIQYRWATTQEKPKAAALPCPTWDGQPFAGTLLVTAEQGLGDEVLSSSMFEELARIGQDAVIDCEVRLLPLFQRSFPQLRFTDRASDALERLASAGAGGRPTKKIEAIELGRYFRRDRLAMPARDRWLVADPEQVAYWRQWLARNFPGRRTVGVSWRSRRQMVGDSKSIPPGDLRPLLASHDMACISLQYGDIAADLELLRGQPGVELHVPPGLEATRNIDGLCALIAALDAVVTCSNTTAHLAGAQGVPTCVLVPGGRYVLWYWGHEGDRTPWYPSLRLFRGPPQRPWPTLVGEATDLVRTLPATQGPR